MMHERIYTRAVRWLALFSLIAFGIAAAGAATTAPANDTVEAIIARLADPDRAVRSAAQGELLLGGPDARAAVLHASRDANPAIARGASEILLEMPWRAAGDPPEVAGLLNGYGQLPITDRINTIAALIALPDGKGIPALLRLVQEEPSEDICWNIVTTLRYRFTTSLAETLRKNDPPANRPAACVLAGMAWASRDREHSNRLLQAAIQYETSHPTYDNGELDLAFDGLVEQAVNECRFTDAVTLRRTQCARIGVNREGYPRPVFQLFALHAKFGPLEGFDEDLSAFSDYLGEPQVMYALSRIAGRDGQFFQSLVLESAAFATSIEVHDHTLACNFVAESGWNDLARREAYANLDCDDGSARIEQLSARLKLAVLATGEDNDAAAIEHYVGALQLLREMRESVVKRTLDGSELPFDVALVEMEIDWRRAKIALDAGDLAAAKAPLDSLAAQKHVPESILLSVYPLFVRAARPAEAQQFFMRAYSAVRETLDQSPDDPMQMNEVAWLSARCGQKLNEALALAEKAAAAQPANAAFLDTLAETHFQLGHARRAVEIEQRALTLQPWDTFMQQQLERFRAAAATQPAP